MELGRCLQVRSLGKFDLLVSLEFLVLNVVPYAEFLRCTILPRRAEIWAEDAEG